MSVGKFCHAAGGIDPPRSTPRRIRAMIPSLLLSSAFVNSDERTVRALTGFGTAIPWLPPIVLIHVHLTLWMCAASERTVRRGEPGMDFAHNSDGRFSIRYVVTRLFVRHAAINSSLLSWVSLTPCLYHFLTGFTELTGWFVCFDIG